MFSEENPIDNSIFKTIDKIATVISEKAKAILPSKEAWKRSGLDEERGPIMNNYMVELKAGGGFYALDYSDRIKAELPAITLSAHGNMPVLHESFVLGADIKYMNESPIENANPRLEGSNVKTQNYVLGAMAGYDLDFGIIAMRPKILGGYIFQSTTVTGERNENLNNSLPFAGLGIDVWYSLNFDFDLILSLESFAEFESGNMTLLNLGSLGVGYRF